MTDDLDEQSESDAGPAYGPAFGATRFREQVPRPIAYVVESVLIIVIYMLLGDLNRQFTPPPMGIAPIWLPAGYALGIVLVRGWWTVIPLGITGILATFRTDYALTAPVSEGGIGMPMQTLIWASILYALAIISHVVIARLLVERYLGRSTLDSVGTAMLFLLIVGPISCIFSALLGTEVFRVEGFLAPGTYDVSVFTFWIGDSIACVLMAPLFIAAFGTGSWRERLAPIALVSIATTTLVLAITSLIGSSEILRIKETFSRSTNTSIHGFEQRMQRIESSILDFASIAAATQPIDSETFVQVAEDRFERLPSADLFAYIETPDGSIDRARIEHAEGHDPEDFIASWIPSSITRQLTRARDERRLAWVPERDDPGATADFVYGPVFDSRLGASPRSQLIGFIAVRTNLQAALNDVLHDVVDDEATAVIFDERVGSEDVLLAASPMSSSNVLIDDSMSPQSAARTNGVPFSTSHEFAVGGSRWVATFAPSAGFVREQSFLAAILPSSLLAMLLAITIGVLALASTGQHQRLTRLVRSRTRAVRASEHRYRSVIENVREAIFQIDADDHVTFANSAWSARLTADAAQAVLGTRIDHALDVTDAGRLTAMARDARAKPGIPVRGEFAATDEALVFEVRMIAPPVSVVSDGDSPLETEIEPGAVVGTIVDMTDQRAVLRNRERFVSLVAHELRNPLTVISGSVQTISNHEQDELPPLAARLLPAVRLSAEKLDRIIADLLVSSQVDAGTLTLVEEPTDLRKVVESTIDTASVSAQEHGVTLVDEVPDAPLEATCDVDRVAQVLDNLLSNAIKYTPSGGEIHVGAELTEQQEIRISVSDTGIGIAPDDHRSIFERYGRTDYGSTMATGTGLGLAICLAIAEAHGGTIQVDSDIGEGSTFVFVLPTSPEHARS